MTAKTPVGTRSIDNLRDSLGKLIFTFSAYFGIGSNISAECIALLTGLLICEKMQVKQTTIRSDSHALINFVEGKAAIPWILRPLFRKISRYKQWCQHFNIAIGNPTLGNTLAKEAQSHKSIRIINAIGQASPSVIALIKLDCSAYCNFRF